MSMPTKGKHHHLAHHHHHHSQQQQPGHHNPQQHQILVNVNQQGVQHSGQPYNTVVTSNAPRFLPNAGSDFHVSGQNYGTQPGGQVGGGGGSVGVPGGRGPPQLGGLQSIGQSGGGLPPGGPAGGQAPPQAPAPGVQNQQPQGPAPTTTPPVHTPSPQEMGKQTHLQPQQPLAQVYGPTQTRPPSQSYYAPGPRPQQPRGISHRGGQGGTGAQVVGMSGVGGGGGQPATIYHTAGLPVQASAMYQVPNLHPGAHQQSVYPMNSQIPLQYPGPPQRHQTHQNQSYYTPLQHSALFTQNMFGYGTPAPAQSYYWPAGQPTNTQISLSRAGASAVSGGAQHVAGPLAGAQGAPVVPQGTLQQPTQQGQPLPPMGISLSQTDVYSGHNGGATNQANSAAKSRKPRGQNAILDIVDPTTGKNISNEIYKDNETIQSGESSNRETPQPQNNGGVAQFDSGARVKVANEESDSDSSAVPIVAAQSEHIVVAQSLTPSLPSIQTSSSSSNGANNSQCNTGPPTPTQNLAPSAPSALCSQPLGTTASNVAHLENVSTLQATVKEFHPRNEFKAGSVATVVSSPPVVLEEPAPTATSTVPLPLNKDDISVQLAAVAVPEVESAKSSSILAPVTVAASVTPAPITPAPLPPVASSTSAPTTNVMTHERTSSIVAPVAAPAPPVAILPTPPPASIAAPEPPKPTITAPVVTPLPPREPIIPNPPAKTAATPSSPPRRKSQTHTHQPTPIATESLPPPPPSSAKEPKEKKTREKSLSSRGATPTPAPLHNQTTDHHHHQKANGDATAEKPEPELPTRNEVQQQKADGKAMQKQKTKNKLKPRDLNRKGAEKEGTDMDAFVNAAAQPPTKSEGKQQQQQQPQPPQPQQPLPPQQQQQENKEVVAPTVKDSNKEPVREIPKEVKDKDNLETKKEDEKEREKEIPLAPVKTTEKHVAPLAPEIHCESIPSEKTPVIEKLPSNKEMAKEEPSPNIEDSLKTNTCNLAAKSVPNDVVDHAKVKDVDIDVEAIVAQKNEENSKVSSRVSNDEKPESPPVIESKMTAPNDKESATPPSNQLSLKYKYKEGQWSPINKDGKRVYDREFLMRLQDDPHSKVKPTNLPDLEVVLKDNAAKARSMVDIKSFKDTNMHRHDALYPAFMKPPALNARSTVGLTRKSVQLKPSKPTKQIHVSLSLREDVKLRESENAWRPARLKPVSLTEEESKTEALYKKVRSVLNKLTPQKFSTLVDQVRALTIDTPERLQGVINLVFEKAVDEPSFSVAYALMCKELGLMEVASSDKNAESEKSLCFRKLIIARCQEEFEKNPTDEVARAAKMKEIDECTDPAKKKDMQLALEEQDRRIRVKSVGNIRFIGELHKQGMLTSAIMRGCITVLLRQNDEDSLECLCKLLTTIGKDMDTKGPIEEMDRYFTKMRDLVGRRGKTKISSRIRFMLQDVIDLRANKWVPRRDDNRPKTIDEIQRDAESERLDSQLNNTPMNTPRKDDRNSDRKRNRGGLSDEGGWSQASSRSSRQTYSVETAKLKNRPPPMEEVQLGSRNAYLWKQPPSAANSSSTLCPPNKYAYLENMTTDQDKPRMSPQLSVSRSTGSREYGRDYHKPYVGGRSSRNGSQQLTSSGSTSRDNSLLENSQSQNMSSSHSSLKSASQSSTAADEPMSEEKFAKVLDTTLKEYLKNSAVEKTAVHIQQTFPEMMMTQFIRETVNFVLEKSPIDRERISRLLSQLLSQRIVSFTKFKDGFCEVLEIVDDLVIDIPKIWTYLAEILSNPLEDEAIPLSDLKSFFDYLVEQPCGVTKFLGEVLSKLCKSKGPKWVAEKWDQSGLQLSTIIDSKPETVDKFIKDYTLEFLKGDFNSAKSSTSSQLSYQQIQQQLKRLMKENTFDEICSWIIANVGQQVKESKFIRVLTTAILETCIDKNLSSRKWYVKEDTLVSLQQLIRRFVDANEVLELQCLYAVQSHMTKLDHPYGIMLPIVKSLADHNIISNDAFLSWRDSDDPAERVGHVISTMSLTSFFQNLQERADDASSVEDLVTGVGGEDRC